MVHNPYWDLVHEPQEPPFDAHRADHQSSNVWMPTPMAGWGAWRRIRAKPDLDRYRLDAAQLGPTRDELVSLGGSSYTAKMASNT